MPRELEPTATDGDITIRPMLDKDLPPIHRWMREEEFRPFIRIEKGTSPIRSVKDIPTSDPVLRPVILYERTLNGWLSFIPDDADPRVGEVGIFLGLKENWGKGVGPRAMGMFLEHLFGKLNVRMVFMVSQEWNMRSRRMFAGLGFREAGMLRKMEPDPKRKGEFSNMVFMDLLASEWAGIPRRKPLPSSHGYYPSTGKMGKMVLP